MLIKGDLVPDFEIAIGLIAPIGADLDLLSNYLGDQLRTFGYDSEVIRLSQLFDVKQGQESFAYYAERMDACNRFRANVGSGDAVAALAVARMVDARRGAKRTTRKAWIFRTLKHEEEVALLRQVFGERFVLVGAHQAIERRRRHLARLATDGAMSKKDVVAQVEQLIDRDQYEEDNPYGQHLREAFSSADYFVDLDRDARAECARLVGLLFGEPFLTPTRDESAMFSAFAASLRSADPGRQVGAVIATHEGEIIATGVNEVPRHGGGEYWAGDPDDARDFAMGFDYNKRQLKRVLTETLDVLAEDGHLGPDLRSASSEDRYSAVWAKSEKALRGTRQMSLIEFGRVVHAEMSALMQAARRGTPVKDATLYTTAFPCHMCMRLVIASGVARVVFVDPYPKSLAFDMYEEALGQDGHANGHIPVESFRGAGWGVYVPLFTAINRDRRADGSFIPIAKATARYRLAAPDPLLNAQELEDLVTLELAKRIDNSNVGPTP
jgi:cytidine deaminase